MEFGRDEGRALAVYEGAIHKSTILERLSPLSTNGMKTSKTLLKIVSLFLKTRNTLYVLPSLRLPFSTPQGHALRWKL